MRNLWAKRHLVVSLTRRQYQLRYRQSLAGFTWAIIPPLATLATATLVFHNVLGVGVDRANYPLFVLAGLVPWTFFSNAVTFGVSSVVQSYSMVANIPFPKMALPLSAVGTSLLDLVVSSGVFVAFIALTGVGLPSSALWFPLLILIVVVLALGLVMLTSALNVFSRDLRLVTPFVMQLWMILTPVMYPLEEVEGNLRGIYIANPMTGVVESFRSVLVYGENPDFSLLLPAMVLAIVVLVIGTLYFSNVQHRFADVI